MTPSQPILLIIDDEPGIVALIERFAEPLAFTVLSHTSAGAALSSLSDIKPDIALVDLQMPDVNGLEVLRQIRATVPHAFTVNRPVSIIRETCGRRFRRGRETCAER